MEKRQTNVGQRKRSFSGGVKSHRHQKNEAAASVDVLGVPGGQSKSHPPRGRERTKERKNERGKEKREDLNLKRLAKIK